MKRAVGAALALLLSVLAVEASAQADAERLRSAKALFFDGRYADARAIWQAVAQQAAGADADAAAYWTARCSEKLGETDRAFREFEAFLDRKADDATLVEEARTSRVGLAARMVRAGQKQRLPVLREALSDPSRTVRYYAAFQLADLGADVGRSAVPVLKKIVAEERDPDLVDRAKLKLLRLDPGALRQPAKPPSAPGMRRGDTPPKGREASWLRVRIYKKGGNAKAEVSINVPVALAELLFKSLPEDALEELKGRGYDAENFFEKLRKLGPQEIVTIEGDDGERIQIWLE
ncbi:MAG: hypothetical protein HY317_01735 [Acidobacteria bacterium]|nr:hypothetical protein [Acidobacteriota bacterium]